jgi:hypothetical protein
VAVPRASAEARLRGQTGGQTIAFQRRLAGASAKQSPVREINDGCFYVPLVGASFTSLQAKRRGSETETRRTARRDKTDAFDEP